MGNKITINVVPMQVGISYEAASAEAEPMDQLRSMEFGLHALTSQIIKLRHDLGLRIPGIYLAVLEANTHQEVM
jgi:hypothetical protein